MRSGDERQPLETQYEKLLEVLTRTGKYLEGLEIDPSVLKSYKALLRYLRAQPSTRLPEMIGDAGSKKRSAAHKDRLSDDEIRSMSVARIDELASDKEVPRSEIERIAVVRFGMTAGGLSNLRSRDALAAKLRTLIENETTHESIARAAAPRLHTP